MLTIALIVMLVAAVSVAGFLFDVHTKNVTTIYLNQKAAERDLMLAESRNQ